MRLILLLLLSSIFVNSSSFGGAGTYPQGSNVKLLKDRLEFKNSKIGMGVVTLNPTITAVDAPQGSLLIFQDKFYIKKDAGSTTNWDLISSPTTTLGDIIVRGDSGDERLALGSQSTKLASSLGPSFFNQAVACVAGPVADGTYNNAGVGLDITYTGPGTYVDIQISIVGGSCTSVTVFTPVGFNIGDTIQITGVNGTAFTTSDQETWTVGPSVALWEKSQPFNSILNSNMEPSVGGYSRYLDVAGTIPVDGTGGSANIQVSENAVTPLMGAGDLKFSKDVVNRQGEGVSYDFTIDNGQQAKKLIISFEYDASHANYADDDIGIFIYDVTNAKLIRINGENLKGGKGTHYAQFQTAPDSKSYRLIFHVASTNATAYDVYFDNISVGPQIITHGAIVTDWEAFTPTGTFTTNTSYTGLRRRVGDTEEYRVTATFSGAPNTTSFQVNVPSDRSIDEVKLGGVGTPAATVIVGNVHGEKGGSHHDGTVRIVAGSTLITPYGDDGAGQWNQASPVTWANTDFISLEFSLPIQGWASTAKMSSDFSGRDIYFHAYRSAGQTISGSGTINFDAELNDSTSSYDTSTYTYTIPETGRYLFSAGLEISVTPTAGQVIALDFKVNGTDTYRIFRYEFQASPGSVMQPTQSGTREINLNKGDTVTVEFIETLSGALTLIGNTSSYPSYFSGHKLASPQTQLENETVAASYRDSSGLSIPDSTVTVLPYGVKVIDTHNAFDTTTETYTVPVSGFYCGTSKVATVSNTVGTGTISLAIRKDNVDFSNTVVGINGATMTASADFCDNLNEGEEIKTIIYQNNGAARNTYSANDNYSEFSIWRVK